MTVKEQKRERQQKVGQFLRDHQLTAREIAAEVGLTSTRVLQIRREHFPDAPPPVSRKRRAEPAGRAERREKVGRLLRDDALSLADIARETGVTRERIRQIQQTYFPDTPQRARGCPADREREKNASALLADGLGLSEIAEQLKTSRTTVERVRRKYFPGYNPALLRRELHGIIRDSGAKYCPGCHRVKDDCEFAPSSLEGGGSGGLCRECARQRMHRYYHENPQYREYLRGRRVKAAEQRRAAKKAQLLEIYAPEAAKQVRQGSLTLTEAMEQLKIPPPEKTSAVHVEASVLGFLAAITEYLSPEEIKELRRRL